MKRESNIELLRIVAMFMILGLHANYYAIGVPGTHETSILPLQSFTRFLLENICIVGVNVFVLISGWFGINYKSKGLCNFLFQCLFFSIAIYVPFAIYNSVPTDRVNIMSAFLLYKNAYWFVWAYLVLYIFAPVLNSFITSSGKNTVKRVLVLFFLIQTICSFFTGTGFFQTGYNPLSFFCLYLLARYFRLHRNNNGKHRYLGIYLLCTLSNTLIYFISDYSGHKNGSLLAIITSYTNPLNIVGALSLLLFFTKFKLQSKCINWLASSCFSVYLLHMHFCISSHYAEYAREIFENFSGITYFVIILTYISSVFFASVIIDKGRIAVFNHIWNKYEKHKCRNDHP